MAVSTAGDSPPDVLARTIGACGRLGCDQIVLDSLARHLMTGVDKLQPEQMQQLVRVGLAGLQLAAVLCDCMADYAALIPPVSHVVLLLTWKADTDVLRHHLPLLLLLLLLLSARSRV